MMAGFLSVPEPFDCSITCRSDKHRHIIEKEFEGTKTDELIY
jgi:hypothetical protein